MDDTKDLSPAGQAIVFVGVVLGLIAGGAASFLLSVGIVPGILLGMAGPLLGMAIARPIAKAVTRRKA